MPTCTGIGNVGIRRQLLMTLFKILCDIAQRPLLRCCKYMCDVKCQIVRESTNFLEFCVHYSTTW